MQNNCKSTFFMKRILLSITTLVVVFLVNAAEWSFSGGYIYFDNSQTQWTDNSIMLIIGKSDWSGVYEMTLSSENRYFCALPSSGWNDAEYMAVIGGSSVWNKGEWGADNLKNANHYTATYTSGLKSTAGQGYLLTPQSSENGCKIKLTYLGENYSGITFSTQDKNNCYRIDTANQQITFIFSTSATRFNISRSDIRRIYVYGSITAWDSADENYRLKGYSDDGCYYRTFPFSAIERVGNSGQPEFLFHVFKQDGTDFTVRSHSSWEGGIDKRLVFINNGENMVVALPNDDLDEIYSRCQTAQYVAPLSSFDLTQEDQQKTIANFRLVPGTVNLFRSYHPFDASRPQYDTEERRLHFVAEWAQKEGVRCDIALSGDMTGNAGKTYTCGGQQYTITIPDYYKQIIANNNVLYVGSQNGHTPSFNDALYRSDGDRFAEWIKEVVEFIIDESHPAPFQIHCALGSDRTGAFCATIAALCGASWEEIAADYEATSNLKIQEYRHRNCIRYCLRHICGIDPATDDTFNEAIRRHFVDGGWLTEQQIDLMIDKLQSPKITEGLLTIEEEPSIVKQYKNGKIIIHSAKSDYNLVGQKIR